jgi:hypothetical protein
MEPMNEYDFRLAESSDVVLGPPTGPVDDLAAVLPPPAEPNPGDVRLYVPDSDGWEAHIKRDSEKIYCYQKLPGDNFFHLILNGELYLLNGHEKLCLMCALRSGVVTLDRLHWQHRVKRQRAAPM